MGLDDIVNKAKEAAEDIADKAKEAGIDPREKADEVLHSDLDAGEKAANTVTGGKFEEQVDRVRDGLDAKVGNDGTAAAAE